MPHTSDQPSPSGFLIQHRLFLYNPRPLKNSLFCHSGLDPESREWLKILDSGACPGLRSGIRRNDKIAGFIQLCKGLE
ncbi:MAG: hypothetical protein NTZ24_05025 [Deltaproteobacteria bacterium]|nr:hypothetical protein [Deltaproteobacteria bacterium]